MTFRRLLYGAVPAILLLAAGCVPSAQSQADEEKESHFLAGKSRVSTMDIPGAIDAFEKALEVNPHSGAAHFELGCLFDKTDPAAAIYHFQAYLKLRPEAQNQDVVKQRITTCKQELAKNVVLAPLTDRQQREFEQLLKENKDLGEQIKKLTEERDSWRAAFLRLQPAGGSGQATGGTTFAERPESAGLATGTMAKQPSLMASGTRTHTVKAGETLSAIAKKYGVRLDRLASANPSVDAHRLRVGTVLQVPGS